MEHNPTKDEYVMYLMCALLLVSVSAVVLSTLPLSGKLVGADEGNKDMEGNGVKVSFVKSHVKFPKSQHVPGQSISLQVVFVSIVKNP